ncbi:MAG: hypothetical protein ACKN9J_05315 [Holophagaceae bacterium]|jgi:hypothetical protein
MIIASLDDLILGDDSDGPMEEIARSLVYAGNWCTAFFLIRIRKESEPHGGSPLLWVHRYQKTQGGWKLMAKVHLTNESQMKALNDLLESLPEN